MPDKLVKVTRQRAVEMHAALAPLADVVSHPSFAFAVAKTRIALAAVVNACREVRPTGLAAEFDAARADVVQQFADPTQSADDTGMVRIRDRDGYAAAVEALAVKMPQAAAEFTLFNAQYAETMAEATDVTVTTCGIDKFPPLSPRAAELLLPMVE